MRTVLMTAATMVAFAGNSILCRMALGGGNIDAIGFTAVRLLSGALVLMLLVRFLAAGSDLRESGGWFAAAALLSYALAFSLAYLRLPAGVGALVLFGAVQVSMIGWGLVTGERPSVSVWFGLMLAFAGFFVLVRPGLAAPDPPGCALMALAGASWGVYSLRGRGGGQPMVATASNFVRTVPIIVLIAAVAYSSLEVSPRGIVLAAASGALASGLGYSLWYAVVPMLTATRAAVVQLVVPVLATAGGVLLLGETLTPRLVIASVVILGGVGLAIRSPAPEGSRDRGREAST